MKYKITRTKDGKFMPKVRVMFFVWNYLFLNPPYNTVGFSSCKDAENAIKTFNALKKNTSSFTIKYLTQ